MKKRLRLTRQRDFQRVLATRRVYSGRGLVAFGVASQAADAGVGAADRIGIAVSRRIKGSVRRNLARRRLREAARSQLRGDSARPARGIAFDVVLIARPEALTLPFPELQLETATALSRVAGR
jgi:ribonuclease P protein component